MQIPYEKQQTTTLETISLGLRLMGRINKSAVNIDYCKLFFLIRVYF
jgi:hypothetical protein